MRFSSPIAPEAACSSSLETISADLQSCRRHTLALCADLTPAEFYLQSHLEFSPIGWHLGHIAYTESLWTAERLGQRVDTPPAYRQLFDAEGLPKAERQNLPSPAETIAYLAVVRERTERCLRSLGSEADRRLWHWLIQHESQHIETISMVLAMHRLSGRTCASGPSKIDCAPTETEMVLVEAGEFYQGSDRLNAIDNERSAHPVYLESYYLDRTPVTCAQYCQFIEAGGYCTEKWWSPSGWRWQQLAQVEAPLYWQADAPFESHPVCGVSWYEAEAYARFVGKRLPTEGEWEKAAGGCDTLACNHSHQTGSTMPVGRYSQGASAEGCLDMLGNAWEWTDTWFDPYPGFKAFPYEGYSSTYFDGEHRVLKGGSWATPRWVLRHSFRNWYHPHRRELFAGFRCAASV